MNNIVVLLEIGTGTFDQGFPVTLRILENSIPIHQERIRKPIPPNPPLPSLYADWQHKYSKLGQFRKIQPVSGQATHESVIHACKAATQELQSQMRQWFQQDAFQSIRDRILAQREVRTDGSIPIVIDVHTGHSDQDMLLRKLPWHLWNLFNELPKAEIVLYADFNRPIATLNMPVNILAIFGSPEGGLQLSQDVNELNRLRPMGANLTCLEQPPREELHKALQSEAWDIVFFAGHSSSEEHCQTGYIQIGDHRSLSLNDLEEDLRTVVKKGLKLAIFNSCDGLGIASYLAGLQVPSMVVMREPVPDLVAREFLHHFLKEFSGGTPLCLAVREARSKLQWRESAEHPCPAASWLPIVCQNPSQPELVWATKPHQSIPAKILPRRSSMATNPSQKQETLKQMLALLITLGILGALVFWIFKLTNSPSNSDPLAVNSPERDVELTTRFSNGDRQLIAEPTNPAKSAGIGEFASGNYGKAVDWFAASLKLNPNDPETLIYLNNARLRAAQRQTYAIAASVPIGNNPNIAQEILRGVAQAQDEINKAGGINGVGLDVRVINDDNNPSITKQIAEILVNDNRVLAFIGHNTGDASLSAAPIYQQHGLVMISPTTFNAEVSKVGNYIFRAVPTPQSMSVPLVEYILKRSSPETPKILICYDSSAPDQATFRDSFVDALTNQGGEVVKVVDAAGRDRCDYSSPGFDPDEVISAAIAQGADSIFLGTNINDFDPTLRVIRANNRRLPLYSSPTLYTQKIIQEGQDMVDGLVLVAPWNPDAYPAFAQSARNLWGATVNWRTATAYDATRAVIAGLQQSNTRDGLQSALQNPNFSTSGSGDTIRFLDTRDRRLTPILVQVQPNKPNGYRFVYLR